MSLTPKQRAFAEYYIQTGNATESAINAGYSKKYANTNASKLLQNTTIKEYVDKKLEEMSSNRIAGATEVMEYLTKVLRGEEQEEVAMVVSTGDFSSTIEKTKKEVAPKDKLKAAELLGKRYKLFTDKQEVELNQRVIVVDDMGDDDDE